ETTRLAEGNTSIGFTTISATSNLNCNECDFTTTSGSSLKVHLICNHSPMRSTVIREPHRIESAAIHEPDANMERIDESSHNSTPRRTHLKCIECSFSTHSVNSFCFHLKNVHNTTPTLASLIFRCDCGNETQSNSHSGKCPNGRFTLIRTRIGPIRRIQNVFRGHKCDGCEKHLNTARAYADHLYRRHRCSLRD
ncbi:hypothetical protein PENTCL1PPCAC_7616, partial [Pristionchus entomophagus]